MLEQGHLLSNAVRTIDPHLTEESTLPPDLLAIDVTQTEIDFLQMPFARMAGNAFQVNAEKNLAGGDGDLVVSILLVDLDIVEIVDVISNQKISRTIHPI